MGRHVGDVWPDVECMIDGVPEDCNGRSGNPVVCTVIHDAAAEMLGRQSLQRSAQVPANIRIFGEENGAATQGRTVDLSITNGVLYH